MLRRLVILFVGVALGIAAAWLASDPETRIQILGANKITLASAETVAIPNASGEPRVNWLAPRRGVRTPDYAAHGFATDVDVDLVVGPSGRVVSAEAVGGPQELFSQAVAVARGWRFRPFERKGRPVYAKFRFAVPILPPVRRPDYRAAFPDIRDWRSLRIRLERTACLGWCPSYVVEIHGDGTVFYRGEGYVAMRGLHRGWIEPETVRTLVGEFRKAEFFWLHDRYEADVTDLPIYTVGIAFDGRTREVVDYAGEHAGMPSAIADLEDAIDRAVGIRKWTMGDEETAPSLVAEGWDFQGASEENLSMLAGVARYGSARAVTDLIAAGARIGGVALSVPVFGDEPRHGALFYAAARGELEMTRALLAAGAAANDPREAGEAALAAAETGNAGLLGLLLIQADPKYRDARGRTVLMNAARSGAPDAVALALRFRPDLNAADADDMTALMHSVHVAPGAQPREAADAAKVVRLLIEAGADVRARTEEGDTALLLANTDAAVVRALIAGGADVNAQNKEGFAALAESLDPDVTRALLEAGASPWLRDEQDRTQYEIVAGNPGLTQVTGGALAQWVKEHGTSEAGLRR